MLAPSVFLATLDRLAIRFFVGVPDSLLKNFCAHAMETLPTERHMIVANEGSAIGVAIGHYLSTGTPTLVYMQNSGFGNAVNPLISLADHEIYGVPMLLLVGWRGQPGVKDEPQHVKQGRVMTAMLEAMEVPWSVMPKNVDRMEQALQSAVATSVERRCPYVLLVEKDTFASENAGGLFSRDDADQRPSREAALRALLPLLGESTFQVSTTGMLSRELFESRPPDSKDADRDFLTVGGMGHCSAIALGLALHRREQEVWCLDGDGALLMHMGFMANIARSAPSNLFHVVFNNGVHDSVGGQPTAIDAIDLVALARAAGYSDGKRVTDLAELADGVTELRASGGPALLEIVVRPGNRPDIGRPTMTPQEAKDRFMAGLR